MLSERNRKFHDDLRNYIAIIREYSLYSNLLPAARIAFVALSLDGDRIRILRKTREIELACGGDVGHLR